MLLARIAGVPLLDGVEHRRPARTERARGVERGRIIAAHLGVIVVDLAVLGLLALELLLCRSLILTIGQV